MNRNMVTLMLLYNISNINICYVLNYWKNIYSITCRR